VPQEQCTPPLCSPAGTTTCSRQGTSSVDCTSQLFPPDFRPARFSLRAHRGDGAGYFRNNDRTRTHTYTPRALQPRARRANGRVAVADYNYSDSSVTLSRRALQFFLNYGLSRIRFLLRVRTHLPPSPPLSLSLIGIGYRALIKRASSRFFLSSRSVPADQQSSFHLAMKNYISHTYVLPLSLCCSLC